MKQGRWREIWKRKVAAPIGAFLKQGATPHKIALCFVLGATISVFPILGTTTIICTIVALLFKLNLPAIQAVNWLFAGVQLILLIPFMLLGQAVVGADTLPLSPSELKALYVSDPWQFMSQFGGSVIDAVVGWVIVAVPVGIAAYFLLRYGFSHMKRLRAKAVC